MKAKVKVLEKTENEHGCKVVLCSVDGAEKDANRVSASFTVNLQFKNPAGAKDFTYGKVQTIEIL